MRRVRAQKKRSDPVKPSAEALTPQRIAEAALAAIKEGDKQGFTMRAVAASLKVTPTALYHHFRDKASIVALMVERAVEEHPIAPQVENWREDLLIIAHWSRDHFFLYPGLAQLRSTYNVWSENAVAITERWLNDWRRSGLSDEMAKLAATASSFAMIGMVDGETRFWTLPDPSPDVLANSPDFYFRFDDDQGPRAVYDLAARAIFNGLHAQLRKRQQRPLA
jgi:AcrR family transcriptional regulator